MSNSLLFSLISLSFVSILSFFSSSIFFNISVCLFSKFFILEDKSSIIFLCSSSVFFLSCKISSVNFRILLLFLLINSLSFSSSILKSSILALIFISCSLFNFSILLLCSALFFSNCSSFISIWVFFFFFNSVFLFSNSSIVFSNIFSCSSISFLFFSLSNLNSSSSLWISKSFLFNTSLKAFAFWSKYSLLINIRLSASWMSFVFFSVFFATPPRLKKNRQRSFPPVKTWFMSLEAFIALIPKALAWKDKKSLNPWFKYFP